MKNIYIQYYVEGDDEKTLVDVLKKDLRVIKPGKLQEHQFDINRLWSAQPEAPYDQLGNQADKLKEV